MSGTDLVLLASFLVLAAASFRRIQAKVPGLDLIAVGLALLVLWFLLSMNIF